MTQWAEIESVPSTGRAPTADGAARGAAPSGRSLRSATTPRLKRTERLIVGSIDAAAHVLQRRARDVLVGSALFMVPMVGLYLLLSVLTFDDFDRLDSLFTDRGYIGVEAGLVLVGLAIQSLTAHIVGAYASLYLVRYRMGGEPTIGAVALATLRRLPLLVVTWAVTHWWAFLLWLWMANVEFSTVVGAALLVGPIAVTASTFFLLVTPVMMGERLGVKAVGRAWRLVRLRFGAAWGFVAACTLLGGVLLLFISVLPSAAEGTGLVTFGSWGWLVQGVMAQVAVLVVVPFSALATAEFYLQTRVHAEGLDIVMAAERAFGRAS